MTFKPSRGVVKILCAIYFTFCTSKSSYTQDEPCKLYRSYLDNNTNPESSSKMYSSTYMYNTEYDRVSNMYMYKSGYSFQNMVVKLKAQRARAYWFIWLL